MCFTMRNLCFLILVGCLGNVVSQCTFPSTLEGSWVTSSDGTWTVNSTTLLGFDTSSLGASPPSYFTCESNVDTKYVLKSETFSPFGTPIEVYMCLDLQEITANKYIFYKATQNLGGRFNAESTVAGACNEPNYAQPYSYHVALRSGSETTALTTCPSSLFGTYTYNTCSDAGSTSTSMNVCDSRQQLIYDYTLCNTEQMFTKDGTLDCVYFATSGSISYLTVYNRDVSAVPDGTTYYLFTCLAVEETGSTVSVTANPKECQTSQDPSTIASPGQAIQFTPITLCPITTTTLSTTTAVVNTAATTETDTSWAVYVGAAIGAIAALAAIAALIICCCLIKRRKKKQQDEEKQLAEEDSDNQSDRSDSRSDKSDEDSRSNDSGISEPPTTGRSVYTARDGDEQELVIIAVGDTDIDDDRGSRPTTRQQMSRMSDLPDSTIPPDDQPMTDRTDEDEDETKDDETEGEQQEQKSDKEETGSDKEEEQKKDEEASGESDGSRDENSPQREEKTSGGESDSDVEGRDHRLIGGKKKKGYMPAGPLTTVLISREDDERKRHKVKGRNKKQSMKKLARLKTRKFGPDGEEELEEDMCSSDEDERKRGGVREAPFLKQYKHKKKIEHQLDEDHYWSDPGEDKDPYRLQEKFDSSSSSDDSQGSGEECEAGSRDGDAGGHLRVKGERGDGAGSPMDVEGGGVGGKRQHGSKDGTKGSTDSIDSVPALKGDSDKAKTKGGDKDKDGDKDIDISDEKRRLRDLDIENGEEMDKKKRKRGSKKTTFINVKEKDENGDIGHISADDLDSKGRPKKTAHRRRFVRRGSDGVSVYTDSSDDEDKLSDVDSGMEEEEELDVILTGEQRQILVGSLFDSDGNLRPEFDMDEEGRIMRRLDNSIIYDPSTGRFTFRKKLGRLFNVPRLKRSKSGRPTGGYIEDEYGPPIPKDSKGGEQNGDEDREGSEYGFGKDDDLNQSRGDNKSVGFMVTEDDDDIPADQLQNGDFKGRGRRDIATAIRRKLNRRLFRKKRRRGDPNNVVPEVQVKKAWTTDGSGNALPPIDHRVINVQPGLNPVLDPRGRTRPPFGPRGQSGLTLSGKRRLVGMTPEQMQLYREGLESDKRILEGLHGKEGAGKRPFEPREAFMELEGESSTDPLADKDEFGGTKYEDGRVKRGGNAYWTGEGRFVIRERGCPDLEHEHRLFTIVRHPSDMETEHQAREQQAMNTQRLRAPASAPITLEDFNRREEERGSGQQGSQISLQYGGSAQGSHMIDDNRLRRLLEELYKDKIYLDSYVLKQEPKSEATVHSKGLAEHGRNYLLERAEYWDQRGPLPPRPPQTEVGWKMHRQHTMWGSYRTSEMGSSAGTLTMTPDQRPYTVPGTVEIQNGHNNTSNNTMPESTV